MEIEAPNRPASVVDNTLMRFCDSKSPEEISAILKGAISPKAVAARTQTLLKSRSWLTVAQEEQVILLKMREVLADIEDKYQDDKMLGLRIKALKEIGALIEKRKNAIDIDVHTYTVNVGREMAHAYDIALSYIRGAISDHIDPDEWDSIAAEALRHAQTEVMKKAIEEDA